MSDAAPTPGRVIVVGDVVTDVLAVVSGPVVAASDTPATVAMTGGGAGANTATWLAAAGAPVTLCAVVGDDAAGTARLDELVAAGVHVAARRAAGAATGAVVVLAAPAERTMLADRGANLRLTPADVDAALAAAPDAVHLHLSGYVLLDDESAPAGRHALAAARARGLTTSVDAASAGPLRRTPEFLSWVRGEDALFANEDEARTLVAIGAADPAEPDTLAVELARAFGGLVVVKRGPDGALAARPDGVVARVDARPAEARDATGAGDAFAAGFLRAWLAGRSVVSGSVDRALAAGADLGARAVSTIGARPA